MNGWKLVPIEPTPEMFRAGLGTTGTKDTWAAMFAAAPPTARQDEGREKVDPKVWHDHYYQAFMRWLQDDSTHWIGDSDAAWQAWMYLHEEGLTPIPDAAMSGEG